MIIVTIIHNIMEKFESEIDKDKENYRDLIAERIKKIKKVLGKEAAGDVLTEVKSSKAFNTINENKLSIDLSNPATGIVEVKQILESAGISSDFVSFDRDIIEALSNSDKLPDPMVLKIMVDYFKTLQKTQSGEHITNITEVSDSDEKVSVMRKFASWLFSSALPADSPSEDISKLDYAHVQEKDLIDLAKKEISDMDFYELDKAGQVLDGFNEAIGLSNKLLESIRRAGMIKMTLSGLKSRWEITSDQNIDIVASSMVEVQELADEINVLTQRLTEVVTAPVNEDWLDVKNLNGIEEIRKRREDKSRLVSELTAKINSLKSSLKSNELSVTSLITKLPEDINRAALVKMLEEKGDYFDGLIKLLEDKYREIFESEPNSRLHLSPMNISNGIRDIVNKKIHSLLNELIVANNGGTHDAALRNEFLNNGGVALDINVNTSGKFYFQGEEMHSGGEYPWELRREDIIGPVSENYVKLQNDMSISLSYSGSMQPYPAYASNEKWYSNISPEWFIRVWIPLDRAKLLNADLNKFQTALGCYKDDIRREEPNFYAQGPYDAWRRGNFVVSTRVALELAGKKLVKDVD